MDLCEGIGNLLNTILEWFLDHTLDEGIEFCLYRDFQLGIIVVNG